MVGRSEGPLVVAYPLTELVAPIRTARGVGNPVSLIAGASSGSEWDGAGLWMEHWKGTKTVSHTYLRGRTAGHALLLHLCHTWIRYRFVAQVPAPAARTPSSLDTVLRSAASPIGAQSPPVPCSCSPAPQVNCDFSRGPASPPPSPPPAPAPGPQLQQQAAQQRAPANPIVININNFNGASGAASTTTTTRPAGPGATAPPGAAPPTPGTGAGTTGTAGPSPGPGTAGGVVGGGATLTNVNQASSSG